jgi:hypothetical protein
MSEFDSDYEEKQEILIQDSDIDETDIYESDLFGNDNQEYLVTSAFPIIPCPDPNQTE